MNTQAGEASEDTFEDLEECFRPVARQHERALFAVVMLAGMAGEAGRVLSTLCEKHQSRGGMAALAQLINTVEQLVTLAGQDRGWTAELLAQVDWDIQQAFRARDRSPILRVH